MWAMWLEVAEVKFTAANTKAGAPHITLSFSSLSPHTLLATFHSTGVVSAADTKAGAPHITELSKRSV